MKSNERVIASDHLELVHAIYIDACAKCIANVSDLRDLKTIRSRVKEEGLSFLTITLPQFCSDFEKSLQSGFIDPTSFRSFRKNGSIPAFLQGMIGLVFDRETGRINDDQLSAGLLECPTIVDSVRQICLAFKKVELDCTPSRVAAALKNYITIESTLSEFLLLDEDYTTFSRVSSVLWGNSMANISLLELSPKHGPGTTAEGIMGNQKYFWRSWHERLEPFFPFIDSGYSISAVGSREFEIVTFKAKADELPVKVITVPKTLKGPRIIAIEPSCMQFAQQAILRVLVNSIESSRFTSGHINFRDQKVNQELAVISSRTGQSATIDLSDASDRVPWSLAKVMFQSAPDLSDAIEACRTTSAKLPSGQIIDPLYKFASMGSALCFPVESMYFYTICVVALLEYHGLPVSHENVFKVSRDVFVYGDDLVVPVHAANVVLANLQKYYCKVNTSKTFVNGSFRESCGVDAYKGELVTPVYVRSDRPRTRQQASELVSWVSTANQFYRKGYWKTSSLMFRTIERILGPLPFVSETNPGLGRITFLKGRTIQRWNPIYQHFEMKCWVPRSVYRSDYVDGYPALQKSLSSLNEIDGPLFSINGGRRSLGILGYGVCRLPVSRDAFHLERTALRGAVALTRRWVPSLS